MEMEATCQVCQKVLEDTSQLVQLGCDHKMCKDCLSSHVLRAIASVDYDCHIVCPARHCGMNIEQGDIKKALMSPRTPLMHPHATCT